MNRNINSASSSLAGRWRVTHRIDASERSDFIGRRIEFDIILSQDGAQLAGRGEKFLVDWQPAKTDETSRLEVTGWAIGSAVQLSLIESPSGAPERTIAGDITWTAVDPDNMTGRFRVNLADTKGRSEAVRILP